MKSFTTLISMFCIAAMILFGCNKDDSPKKDYVESIKDKTWWGTLTYTGQKAEYYSVHFNADKSLLWSQLSGDYPGIWEINDKHLKMTFPSLKSEIDGDISKNDTLLNISDNNATVTINSGKLIANPHIILDNTVWLGSANMTTAKVLELTFIAGSLIKINIENSTIKTYAYTRSLSGSVFRATLTGGDVFFGVTTSDNQMKGSIGKSDNPWQTIKQ